VKIERWARQCEFPACAHPRRLWRVWREPPHGYTLDGHWYCSLSCFEKALGAVLAESLPVIVHPCAKTHRVPLGLLMLSRGLVDDEQLKKALKAQKDSGTGRVGEWLRHMGAVSEDQVTQILGLQWAIPVFPLEQNRRFLDYAHLVPFPLLENAEMVPVHHTPINQQLYVAFVDRVNYSALYAVDKMLSCHTEPCLAAQSHLQRALEELRRTPRGTEVLVVSGISERWDMVTAILDQLESLGATEVRVSGFDGFVWARLHHGSGYSDMLFRPQGG